MSDKIRVQMVKLPVSNIEKALPFYRDVLGLAEAFVVAEYGWAQLHAGAMPVALYVPGMGGGQGEAGKADCLHFAVADGAAFRAQLVAAGLEPEEHLHRGADETSYYELRDPDGNLFKVFVQKAE
jgi:catechol 2,3-dioxygenase-like lactoylglutathione lyase family enzyme